MPDHVENIDIVDDGKRDSGRRRRWPFVVLIVVVVLALAGGWIDRSQRRMEFHTLLSKTADAQTTAVDAGRVVVSTRQYTLPLLVTSSSVTVRSGLEQLVEASAARGASDLRAARKSLAATTILPWHHALRAAKRGELKYLDQRIADFDSVAKGADLALLASPAAKTAATAASSALQSAAPTSADAERVSRTFEP